MRQQCEYTVVVCLRGRKHLKTTSSAKVPQRNCLNSGLRPVGMYLAQNFVCRDEANRRESAS